MKCPWRERFIIFSSIGVRHNPWLGENKSKELGKPLQEGLISGCRGYTSLALTALVLQEAKWLSEMRASLSRCSNPSGNSKDPVRILKHKQTKPKETQSWSAQKQDFPFTCLTRFARTIFSILTLFLQ